VVFDLNHRAVGEFSAIVNRGYMMYGNPSVSGEASTQIVIPNNVARKPWLNFGRPILIEGGGLPAWMGIIDPPWKADTPVSLTAYSGEYLLSLRVPDVIKLPVNGSSEQIIKELIAQANSQADMFIRLGDASQSDGATRQETITQKKVWEQIRAYCERTETELVLRPVREGDRLNLYIDIGAQGTDTGMLLHDGENANMRITNATVIGDLTNRLTGISSQSTTSSRLATEPYLNDETVDLYRLRSDVAQFRDISEITTLQKHTERELDWLSRPRLQITADIIIKDANLARNMRLGNTFMVHASKILLPGGRQGWRGTMRVPKFFFTESTNTVNITMEAFL
jgi:hypothetical protein